MADAAHVRFFRLDNGNKLISAADGELVDGIQPKREIANDRPGRTFDRSGCGRHAMEPHSNPKRVARSGLAHEIALVLDAEREKGAYDRLIVVAPPQFLGDLRAAMPKAVKELIAAEVNKDLSKLSPHQLSAQLSDVLKVRPPL